MDRLRAEQLAEFIRSEGEGLKRSPPIPKEGPPFVQTAGIVNRRKMGTEAEKSGGAINFDKKH